MNSTLGWWCTGGLIVHQTMYSYRWAGDKLGSHGLTDRKCTHNAGLVISWGSYSPPADIALKTLRSSWRNFDLVVPIFGLTRPGIYLFSIFSICSEIVERSLTVRFHMVHHRLKCSCEIAYQHSVIAPSVNKDFLHWDFIYLKFSLYTTGFHFIQETDFTVLNDRNQLRQI
jgi:hypothetical protein